MVIWSDLPVDLASAGSFVVPLVSVTLSGISALFVSSKHLQACAMPTLTLGGV